MTFEELKSTAHLDYLYFILTTSCLICQTSVCSFFSSPHKDVMCMSTCSCSFIRYYFCLSLSLLLAGLLPRRYAYTSHVNLALLSTGANKLVNLQNMLESTPSILRRTTVFGYFRSRHIPQY